jgi:D-sedoheptulose 7-phosphate isomerase
MLVGAKKAKSMNVDVVTLSGFSSDNPLRQLGDINLWVDSKAYNIVEMTHHVWLLAIIDYLIELNKEE